MTPEELAELEAAVDAADDKEVEAWWRVKEAQDPAEAIEAWERLEEAEAEEREAWDRWVTAERAIREGEG